MSDCPVCLSYGSAFKVVAAFGGDYTIHKCSSCRLEYVHPMPSVQLLHDFYSSYEDVRAGIEVLKRNASRNIDRLIPHGLTAQSKLLDYGSGKNIFVSESGENWSSYDPYTSNNDIGVLKNGYYDMVTAWGVLEHVTDPRLLVRRLHALLKKGGYLVMTTVDIDGVIPYRFKPPEHVSYWTRDAVSCLFKSSLFDLINYDPYFMTQDKKVYMDIILRTLPSELKHTVHYEAMPDLVEVPTNEVWIIGRKQ